MLLARAEKQAEIFKEAREYENVGFQWTRRIIALTAIFAIVVLPKILPLIDPQAQVIVGYLEFKPGFLFFEGKDVMQWVPMAHRGIVITPLDTNLVSAIIGLYFGGSLVKKQLSKDKNPLDEFWEGLGDKDKKHVRSYRSGKRNIQIQKNDAGATRRSRPNPSKRGD